LTISQKGHTTVEWTWWRHRNANNKDLFPQSFLANSIPSQSRCRRIVPHLVCDFRENVAGQTSKFMTSSAIIAKQGVQKLESR